MAFIWASSVAKPNALMLLALTNEAMIKSAVSTKKPKEATTMSQKSGLLFCAILENEKLMAQTYLQNFSKITKDVK